MVFLDPVTPSKVIVSTDETCRQIDGQTIFFFSWVLGHSTIVFPSRGKDFALDGQNTFSFYILRMWWESKNYYYIIYIIIVVMKKTLFHWLEKSLKTLNKTNKIIFNNIAEHVPKNKYSTFIRSGVFRYGFSFRDKFLLYIPGEDLCEVPSRYPSGHATIPWQHKSGPKVHRERGTK